MPNDSNKINSAKERQIEQIIDLLFADDSIPEDELEFIRQWIVNENNQEFKNEALERKFIETSRFNRQTKHALDMWPNVAMRIGADVDIVRKTVSNNTSAAVKSVRKPLYRRIGFRVAAALVPVMIMAGSIYFLSDRTKYTADVEPTAQVIVSVPDDEQSGAIAANTVIIAENTTITLPDNSTVRMGKGSEIRHAENFGGERRVELHGEARFNVTKTADDSDSFTIHTEHLKVKVLGTQFNVHSSADENHSTIDLYHGSVEVEAGGRKVVMKPTDRLRFDHDTEQISITHIPLNDIIYDNMPGLVFDQTPVTKVLKKLESDYGVHFVIEGDLSDDDVLVRGDFTSVSSLGGIMGMLQKLSGQFTYEITDNEIKVKINNYQ